MYGGSILPGHHKGRDLTIQDVYEAVGANAAGKMSDEELLAIENSACPGAGACGGQFTANTMATVMELIGLSPLGTAAVPQVDARKHGVAARCGRLVLDLVKNNLKPRDIVTRKAIDNAIASVATTGGSTNAVLHLLAMAREAGVPLGIDDFQTISERTPLLVDLKPAGKFVAVDVDKAGGIPVIAQRLVEGGYVDGSAMTVTGRTLAQEAAEAKETPGQEVIHPLSKPIKKSGGLVILRGSLAPDGCVIKVTGIERSEQRGPARVFESEEDAMAAVTRRQDPAGRHRGDSLRRAARRTGNARDAGRDERDRRRGAFRKRRAADRRPVQRRHARILRRPRRAGSRGGRADRRGPGRRHHLHRHREPHDQSGSTAGCGARSGSRNGKRPSRVTARASSPSTLLW